MARVVVVGGANWDRTWRLPRLPAPGETVVGEADADGPGGKGLNIAVGLARLGVDTALVAATGFDAEADRLVALLVDEGVGTDGLRRLSGTRTGQAAVLVGGGAETAIAVAAGANRRLDARAVTAGLAACGEACDLLVLQAEVGDPALEAALAWAQEARRRRPPPPGRAPAPRILLSPAPARSLPAPLWRETDLCVCNRGEAATLTGVAVDDPLDAETAAVALCALGASTVVVTLGGDGSVVARRGRATYVPPVTVDVVDPTGAGDSAVAAMARATVDGFDVFAAAGYAMAAAAVQVTRPGAAAAMPTADEVDRIVHGVDLRRRP